MPIDEGNHSMELGQYLAALRRRWLLISIAAALGFGGGYAFAAVTTPTFRATSSVFVSLEQGETVNELVQGSTYTQNLVQSYAQLTTLPVVLDPVIDDLDLDTTSRSLANRVSADTPLNTVIINISVVGETPESAAQIADAVAAELAVAISDVSPRDAAGDATVSVRTVAPAQVPLFAISPNTRLYVGTGALAGLAVGVLLALGREILNTRVRTVDDVARVTDLPVLATVPRTRGSVGQQIVMTAQPLSSRAESYRRLRANLQFFGVSDRLSSVVVTSALPGEGKSTTALNLALALAEGPARVLLVDADLRRPSVAEYTGIEGSAGLTTVLIGEAKLEDVVQPWGSERLTVLSSGPIPPNPSQMLDSREMAALLERMTDDWDIVVIDSAPLLPVSDSAILSRLTDGAVLVAAFRDLHRAHLADALTSLEAVGATCLGVVLNRSSAAGEQAAYGYGPAESASQPGRLASLRASWSRRPSWRQHSAPPPSLSRPAAKSHGARSGSRGDDEERADTSAVGIRRAPHDTDSTEERGPTLRGPRPVGPPTGSRSPALTSSPEGPISPASPGRQGRPSVHR